MGKCPLVVSGFDRCYSQTIFWAVGCSKVSLVPLYSNIVKSAMIKCPVQPILQGYYIVFYVIGAWAISVKIVWVVLAIMKFTHYKNHLYVLGKDFIMERKISIPAKLKGTLFFEKVLYLTDCIDINCKKSNTSQSWEMRDYHTKLVRLFIDQWEIAKSALELLTGKTYAFSRTDEYYGIVNKTDENDWLYWRQREGVHNG